MKKTFNLPTSVRAAITSNSYNAADNTIEVVFATEVEAKRRMWDGTNYIEILECTDTSVRLERANAGANLVDTHSTHSVKSILGVVERAWVEKKQCKATVRLSKREDVAGIVDDIRDGIISNISVGYIIHDTEISENSDTNIVTVRIKDWEPGELSVCSVPIDFKAGVRSEEQNHFQEVEISNKRTMEKPVVTTETVVETRSEATNVVVAETPVALDAKQIIAQERKRVSDINLAVRAAQIDDQEFVNGLVERNVSIDQAREAIINKMAENQEKTQVRGQVVGNVTVDEADKRRAGMVNAIMHRANPSVELKEGSDMRGLSLIDMARECIEIAGVKTRGMSKREIAEAGLNIRSGMHSTSDFPIILGNTVNRVLRAEYDIQERTFSKWASRGTAKDFREMSRASLGEVGDFKEVKEGGEYEYTSLGEGQEKYKVVKFGQIVAITWETLINDDLDAFSRVPRKIAAAAARKQSDIVYAILTGSHLMADNVQLFHATHKNLATGAAISIESVTAMRKLIRNQKGLNDKDFLSLTPKYVIAGPDSEQAALQFFSSNYVANTAGNVNVWNGSVEPIIEPRITGNAWYFAASPSMIDTVEYSFLEGEGELFTEQRNGFDVDGLEIKARMVFGAKAIDFRGLAKNPGA